MSPLCNATNLESIPRLLARFIESQRLDSGPTSCCNIPVLFSSSEHFVMRWVRWIKPWIITFFFEFFIQTLMYRSKTGLNIWRSWISARSAPHATKNGLRCTKKREALYKTNYMADRDLDPWSLASEPSMHIQHTKFLIWPKKFFVGFIFNLRSKYSRFFLKLILLIDHRCNNDISAQNVVTCMIYCFY